MFYLPLLLMPHFHKIVFILRDLLRMLISSLQRQICVSSYLSSVFLSSKFPPFFYNIFYCLLLFGRVFNPLSFHSFLVFPPLLYVKTDQSPSVFLLFAPSYLHLLYFFHLPSFIVHSIILSSFSHPIIIILLSLPSTYLI